MAGPCAAACCPPLWLNWRHSALPRPWSLAPRGRWAGCEDTRFTATCAIEMYPLCECMCCKPRRLCLSWQRKVEATGRSGGGGGVCNRRCQMAARRASMIAMATSHRQPFLRSKEAADADIGLPLFGRSGRQAFTLQQLPSSFCPTGTAFPTVLLPKSPPKSRKQRLFGVPAVPAFRGLIAINGELAAAWRSTTPT